MELKQISTPNAPKAIGAYSQAILAGNTLYLSGQIAIDPNTNKLIEDDVAKQTDQVLKNITAILKEAGFGLDNVCKAVCLVKDINDFKTINEVYSTYFSEHKPARALYEVKALPLGALIEIEVTAVK